MSVKKPITVTPETSLLEARDKLTQFKISRLIVTNRKNFPVGILTEKDISKTLYSLGSKSILSIRVKDAMINDPIVVKETTSFHDCAKIMTKNDFSSVVIVNSDSTLAGVITKTDLVHGFLLHESANLKPKDVMTRNVITVSPDDSLFVVQSVLMNNKISRLVVVHKKKPVGVITYHDFVPAKLIHPTQILADSDEREETQWEPWLNQFNVKSLDHALTFRAMDIMSPHPFVAKITDSVSMIALMMVRHGISGIPIVRKDSLVGIVTKKDIVKWMAKIPKSNTN